MAATHRLFYLRAQVVDIKVKGGGPSKVGNMENHLRRPVWLELNAQGVNSTLLAGVHGLRHGGEPYNLAGGCGGVEDMQIGVDVVILAEYTVFSHDLIGF